MISKTQHPILGVKKNLLLKLGRGFSKIEMSKNRKKTCARMFFI
jgi:hypothetical protein